jgi:hypothetical protein
MTPLSGSVTISTIYLAVLQENEEPPAEKEAADKEGKQ